MEGNEETGNRYYPNEQTNALKDGLLVQYVIFNLAAICMLVNLHTLNTSPLLHQVPPPLQYDISL